MIALEIMYTILYTTEVEMSIFLALFDIERLGLV